MTWVYIKSEPQLWTVGFHDPNGKWHPDSDHNSSEGAAARVNYLNGGRTNDLLVAAEYALDMLNQKVPDGTTEVPLALRLGGIGGIRAAKLLKDAIVKEKGGAR